jgi:hypothetical protein
MADLASVVGHFGHAKAMNQQKWAAHGDDLRDANADGVIGAADIGTFIAHFGETCS